MKQAGCVILSGMLLILVILACAATTYAYTSNGEITVIRQMLSAGNAGETITIEITLNVGGGIAGPIRGFYFTDEIPEDLTIETGSYAVTLNGADLSNIVEESGATGDVYPAAVPYRLILETPPDFTAENQLNSGDELLMRYEVTIPSDATGGTIYAFPGYSWVGCILSNSLEYIFGYEDVPVATITVISNVTTSSTTTSIEPSSTTTSIVSGTTTSSMRPSTSTTTALSTTTTIVPVPQCIVTIAPSSVIVDSGEEMLFNVETTLDGEKADGCIYEWEIVPPSDIGSTVDEGNYEAGFNLTGTEIIEYVVVTDVAHDGAAATAEVTVLSESIQGSIRGVFPKKLFRSHWLPMLYFLFIIGDETHFDLSSTASFYPADGIVSLGQMGFGDLLINLVIVQPGVQEGMVDLMVSTGEGEDQFTAIKREAIQINLFSFPLILDHQFP